MPKYPAQATPGYDDSRANAEASGARYYLAPFNKLCPERHMPPWRYTKSGNCLFCTIRKRLFPPQHVKQTVNNLTVLALEQAIAENVKLGKPDPGPAGKPTPAEGLPQKEALHEQLHE